MRACSVAGCGRKHYGKDYCRKHYKWFIEYGHTELRGTSCEMCGRDLAPKKDRFCSRSCQMKWHRRSGCYSREAALKSRGACSMPGCGDPVHANGLCRTHDMRVRRHGDADANFARRNSGACLVSGCKRPLFSLQRCEPHYMRWYLETHREEINACKGARRSRLRQATPPWVDMNAIRKIYLLCAKVSAETGVEHHVDHVVPIKGRKVSGLHVPWNLQIIPGVDNRRKSNKL